MVEKKLGVGMLMPRVGFLVVASLLAAASAPAQENWPVDLGARVRVTAPLSHAAGLVGTVVGLHGAVLVLQPDGRRDSLAFARNQIAKLEVANGRHGHVILGMEIGFLGAATAGAINGTRGPCSNGYNCNGWYSGAGGAALGGVIFGIMGAPLGAIVGALVRTEQWSAVDLGPVRAVAEIRPLDGGRPAIRVSLKF